MVNYREKLKILFELSEKQIEILERKSDTIVRAVPGSGKTTILTYKIKNLLLDDDNINKICCISYTNVNVEDLENSCRKKIDNNLVDKIEFLTFHKFCLNYIIRPFSYLYRSKQGLRPYENLFNYNEHSVSLLEYLRSKNILESEIQKIIKKESIYYNIVFNGTHWVPTSSDLHPNTVIEYWNFLSGNKIIDFNLINLLSLFIIQENRFVKSVLNKTFDWIFIDEFQDVSEIQCKIIEEIRNHKTENTKETRWFIVGDPNQSIYGFAGANPRSMYDIKKIFNDLNNENCEIQLNKTHRCSNDIFEFAKNSYNQTLSRILESSAIKKLNNQNVVNYINDLKIAENSEGNDKEGEVIIKSSIDSVSEIVNLRFKELVNDEVCCIGVNRFNSIDVYRKYKLHHETDEGDEFGIYSDLYRDYEDKYGFKYFSLFIRYLVLKYNFSHNNVEFISSINKFIYSLDQLLSDKLINVEISENKKNAILIDVCNFQEPLKKDEKVFDEFSNFTKRLILSLETNLDFSDDEKCHFTPVEPNDKMQEIKNLSDPIILGFLKFITRNKKEKLSFEVKHIHKIKGLEYEQVIVQKIEDLPHWSCNTLHGSICLGAQCVVNQSEIYNYIQELNKLYVMLTRTKKNLYIVLNSKKNPTLINITTP